MGLLSKKAVELGAGLKAVGEADGKAAGGLADVYT